MPHCRGCGSEHEEGVTRCPDCGEDLVPGSPRSRAGQGDVARPVRLLIVRDVTAGDILRAILAEHGIPAFVQRHGPITGELGRVTDGLTDDRAMLMVPANRLAEAREIVDAIESSPVVWPEGMEPEEDDEGT